MVASEPVEHRLPRAPVPADAVNEQQCGTLAADDIGDVSPVEANGTLIEHHRCKQRLDHRLQFVAWPPHESPAPSRIASASARLLTQPAPCSTSPGAQDARIDRIARRVGINKALVYRHFVSKEELFALTTALYLDEINALLEAVGDESSARANGSATALRRSPTTASRIPPFSTARSPSSASPRSCRSRSPTSCCCA